MINTENYNAEDYENYISLLKLEIGDRNDEIIELKERIINLEKEFRSYWDKYNLIRNILLK